jgi:hypothetical protein
MFKRVIEQQPVDIVSVEQAKAQLNIIDDESEDLYIQSLIDGATNLAERYTNRMLSSGTVEITVGKGTYFIPLGATDSVVLPDGISYSFNAISQRLTIHSDAEPESITATFDVSSLSEHETDIASLGIKMLISSLYENREDTVTMTTNDIPLNSTAILDAIKLPEV